MTQILDHRGQPIDTGQLKQEQAEAQVIGLRSPFNFGSVASRISPDVIASVLERAAHHDHHDFLTLAEEMEERDPHYAAVLGSRKRGITSLDKLVTAASDSTADENLADEVRRLIELDDFEFMLSDALDGLGKGYSVVETLWDTSAKQWMPKGYEWRDPRFFNYDEKTGRELLLITEGSLRGEPLAPFKFITHVPRVKSGIPIRGALARLASVAYMCKGVALGDWMTFAELFGMPIRVAKYGRNATPEEKATLRRAVANIGTDAAAIIPEAMAIEFITAHSGAGGDKLFQGLCEFLDKQVSKGVLGQTMTTDDGSSYSQADVHNDVRLDILEADAKQLAATINRDLIKPFIDLNYGPQKVYPKFELPVPKPEDTATLVESIERLIPYGLRVRTKDISDKLGLPVPDEHDEILTMPAAAPVETPVEQSAPGQDETVPKQAPNEPALNTEQTAPDVSPADEIEQLLSEMADPFDWESQLNGVLQPVLIAIKKAKTEAEFLAMLPDLLEQMDSDYLTERLAVEMFKAKGMGDDKS